MRQICALLIVFVHGVTSIPAFADDVYQPKVVPPCKMYKTALGVDICGFENVEDWKQVLVVDVEVFHLRTQLKNAQDKAADLAQLRDVQLTEITAMADSEKILKAQNEKLTQDLINLDEKYQKERVKPQWGSPIAWTIAAVSTAVLVGFVASSALR